jgi:hypothetical protein
MSSAYLTREVACDLIAALFSVKFVRTFGLLDVGDPTGPLFICKT